MTKKFATFQVAVKVLLKKRNGKVLLLRARKGDLDLPGGRIDAGEERTPLEEIVEREIREELGEEVRFRLEKPVFQYRIFMQKSRLYEFVVVYEAIHITGKIKLSPEHKEYLWVHPRELRLAADDFRVQDREKANAFTSYFQKVRSSKQKPFSREFVPQLPASAN